MSSIEHVSDSEESEVDLLQTPSRKDNDGEASQPASVLSHRFRESPSKPVRTAQEREPEREPVVRDNKIAVMVSPPKRPWEYQPFCENNTVDTVLGEFEGPDALVWYEIEFEDGRKQDISFHSLLKLKNGANALDFYNTAEQNSPRDSGDSEVSMSSSIGKRARTKPSSQFVEISQGKISSESEDSQDASALKKRRLAKGRISLISNSNSRHASRTRIGPAPRYIDHEDKEESSSSEYESLAPIRRNTQPSRENHSGASRRSKRRQSSDGDSSSAESLAPIRRGQSKGHDQSKLNGSVRIKLRANVQDSDKEMDELAEGQQMDSDNSDVVYSARRKGKRALKSRTGGLLSQGRRDQPSKNSFFQEPTRKSGREREVKNMRERDMDEEVYAEDVSRNQAPKVISIREVFQTLLQESPFLQRHNKECDVCDIRGNSLEKGVLIYCQGCSSSIHKNCLGYRSQREAMVTKVGHENFVMQCRRCIGLACKKDKLAPRLDTCQKCLEPGRSCAAFSARKTAKQEEKMRQENDGDDPIAAVAERLVNNPANVLFRCDGCHLGWHFEHLPDLSPDSDSPEDIDELRKARYQEYSAKWQCKNCLETVGKIQALVAWRPVKRESYTESDTVDMFNEDSKEYLLKWAGKSYFACTWMPGSWVWGRTHVAMRNSFYGKQLVPKWTEEEAIPEEFLRMEIVFDVSYGDGYRPKSEESDKEHIDSIKEVYVKFVGLNYDEAVWEEPPSEEDSDRWTDFVAAYDEYLTGKYFKKDSPVAMKERVSKFHSLKSFSKSIELKEQPSSLTGALMPYQLEGLNWLLYNYHQSKNVILADEMGLGKTIQIIAFLATLVTEKPQCWPFLIVTPNSTCPNWRREIKKWAPNLRVVAYYGGKAARQMAYDYELYPNNASDLRAHIVVTSYEAPVDEYSRPFFKKIKWAGMIVDEGQRLKNDENLLYAALKALKTPFQALLTGTPLQNNKRELFNLLQFLDPTMRAAELDEKYEELTKENLPELHELIRPFFLRRTKLQVLKFLPPMAQVILPVTMSLVQKKLYKSILAKNPALINVIIGQGKSVVRPAERGNLNNILMQLRKCLSHPFIYSSAIEEKTVGEEAMNRNMIDASSKFQLLEIMLPKLKERGHRVLLFSQFLDQLDLVEDFLDALDLPFDRLDGKIGALEKQKRIDAFNAPDSPLFAFLLSTRAGGVGINLATADTVIIMDPDFNPKQDLQALSRAHRIGQKNKVLVFQIMTKDTAEEKIVQIGRKKMALDQALIESLDADDDVGVDLESILKHGAAALFNDDDRNDIHYDSASVDKLLDRTQVENTNSDDGKTAESQFSFARVWANDESALIDGVGDEDSEPTPVDTSLWDKILKQREADAAKEAAKNLQTFGRGKRIRQNVNYERPAEIDDDVLASSSIMPNGKRRPKGSDDDTDFAGHPEETDGDEDTESDVPVEFDVRELQAQQDRSRNNNTINSQKAIQPPPIRPPGEQATRFVQAAPGQGQGQGSQASYGSNPPPLQFARPSQHDLTQAPVHHIYPNRDPRTYSPNIQRQETRNPVSPSPGAIPHPVNGRGQSASLVGPSSYHPGNVISNADRRFHQQHPHGGPSQTPNRPVPSDRDNSNAGLREQLHQPIRGQAAPNQQPGTAYCYACRSSHVTGQCPLKLAGVQKCPLCGHAHFDSPRACLSLNSEVQIRLMLDALGTGRDDPVELAAVKLILTRQLVEVGRRKQNARRNRS